MPEHKHTSGPWTINDTHGQRWIEPVASDDPVARVFKKGQQEFLANARLIAAAPDLLQALEELDAMYARAWDTTDGGVHFSAESVPKFEAAHEKASAAIAKALGQA